jgi:hypothetical protein
LPKFKLADVTQELGLLQMAKEDALLVLKGDPNLREASHAPLRRAILRQFGDTLGLAQVG